MEKAVPLSFLSVIIVMNSVSGQARQTCTQSEKFVRATAVVNKERHYDNKFPCEKKIQSVGQYFRKSINFIGN